MSVFKNSRLFFWVNFNFRGFRGEAASANKKRSSYVKHVLELDCVSYKDKHLFTILRNYFILFYMNQILSLAYCRWPIRI